MPDRRMQRSPIKRGIRAMPMPASTIKHKASKLVTWILHFKG